MYLSLTEFQLVVCCCSATAAQSKDAVEFERLLVFYLAQYVTFVELGPWPPAILYSKSMKFNANDCNEL